MQADPLHVVALELEHLIELLFYLPVLELCAIEQHHAAGERPALALVARLGAAEERHPAHVAAQQVEDVANCEDVGVDYERTALVAHQLRRHEAQWREGLQIVVQPPTLFAVAQVELALPGMHEAVVLHLDEVHVELLGAVRVLL